MIKEDNISCDHPKWVKKEICDWCGRAMEVKSVVMRKDRSTVRVRYSCTNLKCKNKKFYVDYENYGKLYEKYLSEKNMFGASEDQIRDTV